MLIHTEARIFLKEERGLYQSQGYKSLRTFNFEEYRKDGREPVGTIRAFNDDMLGPEATQQLSVTEATEIMLLPIAGAIEFSGENQKAEYVDSGEALRFLALPGETYTIVNPYAQETVNYLHIRFASGQLQAGVLHNDRFDVQARNTLLPLFPDAAQHLHIGIFAGREDAVHSVQSSSGYLLAFVIEGAFEVQNRLLERRDALLMQHIEALEFEALSNDAVILVVEFQGS